MDAAVDIAVDAVAALGESPLALFDTEGLVGLEEDIFSNVSCVSLKLSTRGKVGTIFGTSHGFGFSNESCTSLKLELDTAGAASVLSLFTLGISSSLLSSVTVGGMVVAGLLLFLRERGVVPDPLSESEEVDFFFFFFFTIGEVDMPAEAK